MENALQSFINSGFPLFVGRTPLVYPSPVQQQQAVTPEPLEEKEKEKKPERRSVPKKIPHNIQVVFDGRALDAPIFHQVANVFGLDAEDLDPVDRNRLQELIQLTAEKIGSADSRQILNFLRRESHKYPGEHRFREMRMILCMGQKPTVRKSPWGKTGR